MRFVASYASCRRTIDQTQHRGLGCADPLVIVIALAMLAFAIGARVAAQATPPQPPTAARRAARRPRAGRRRRQGRAGGESFPAQQRPPGDPAVIARGKMIFDVACAICHGGRFARRPVERSEPPAVATRAERPGGRADPADRPGFPRRQGHAGAADSARRRQGDRRSTSTASRRSRAVRARRRAGWARRPTCSSATRRRAKSTLRRRAASAIRSPATCRTSARASLRRSRCRTSGSRAAAPADAAAAAAGRGRRRRARRPPRVVTAAISLPGNEKLEGRVLRYDDFLITLALADGTVRTFRRDGDIAEDRDRWIRSSRTARCLPTITNKAMRDLTAYLWTVK